MINFRLSRVARSFRFHPFAFDAIGSGVKSKRPKKIDFRDSSSVESRSAEELILILSNANKNKIILNGPHIRKISDALQSKTEVFSSNLISNALYALKPLKCSHPQVPALIVTLTAKILENKDIFRAQHVGRALYGFKGFNSDNMYVKSLVSAITEKVKQCPEEFNAQEVGNSLYGMANMKSNCTEVIELIKALTIKVKESQEPLRAQEIGNALYGMRFMDSKQKEVLELVKVLAQKIEQSPHSFDGQAIGNSLTGLFNMSSSYHEVRYLLKVLTAKIDNCYDNITPQSFANALYGLSNMSSQQVEVRMLVKSLTDKLKLFNSKSKSIRDLRDDGLNFTPQGISSAIYGLKDMHSKHEEVVEIIDQLLPIIERTRVNSSGNSSSSNFSFEPQHIKYMLIGMQYKTTNKIPIRKLLSQINKCFLSCNGVYTAESLRLYMKPLIMFNFSHPEVKEFCSILTSKLREVVSHEVFAPYDISEMLSRLSHSCSNHTEVKALISVICQIIENQNADALRNSGKSRNNSNNRNNIKKTKSIGIKFNTKEFLKILSGVSNWSSDDVEMRRLLDLISSNYVEDPVLQHQHQSREEIDDTKSSGSSRNSLYMGIVADGMNGLEGLDSRHEEVQKVMKILVGILHKQQHDETRGCRAHQICVCLNGMQRMNANDPYVKELLLALKPILLDCTGNYTVSSVVNGLYGLQNCLELPEAITMIEHLLVQSKDASTELEQPLHVLRRLTIFHHIVKSSQFPNREIIVSQIDTLLSTLKQLYSVEIEKFANGVDVSIDKYSDSANDSSKPMNELIEAFSVKLLKVIERRQYDVVKAVSAGNRIGLFECPGTLIQMNRHKNILIEVVPKNKWSENIYPYRILETTLRNKILAEKSNIIVVSVSQKQAEDIIGEDDIAALLDGGKKISIAEEFSNSNFVVESLITK